MSGRFCLASSPIFATCSLVACVALLLSAAPAAAQSGADTPPSGPTAPPVAPPEADPPAPAPSVPGPPSDAPPVIEPTPAPTPDPTTLAPTPQAEAAAPKSELPPAGSAAFAPLPAAAATPPASVPSAHAEVAAAAPAAKPISHAAPESSKDDDSGGLLGPFRIGVLVGSGLPEVANFGAQLKLTRFFGAGVNVGLIPTVKIKYYGEAAQKYQEYDAYGHIYPFGGSFFFGAGVGYAQVDGTLVKHIELADLQPGLMGSVDLTSDARVRTLVLTPQIGFLKIFDVGFAIGFDLGAQIPIAPSEVHFNTVAAGIPPQFAGDADAIRAKYITPNDEKVRHTLETLGRTPLPTFSFKIGWFL